MTRMQQGKQSYHAGKSAETLVERFYEQAGHLVLARRWRGMAGEIDLIVQAGAFVVFVEVKAAKTHDGAAIKLQQAQMARLYGAASEFLAGQPQGQLTPARFDVALVDGLGQIKIIENAFGV